MEGKAAAILSKLSQQQAAAVQVFLNDDTKFDEALGKLRAADLTHEGKSKPLFIHNHWQYLAELKILSWLALMGKESIKNPSILESEGSCRDLTYELIEFIQQCHQFLINTSLEEYTLGDLPKSELVRQLKLRCLDVEDSKRLLQNYPDLEYLNLCRG